MNVQRVAAVASIVAVVAAVVAGIVVMGSPAEQRLLRLDERRVADLRRISFAATGQWSRNKGLPDSAAGLVDGQYLSRMPEDPSSKQPYEYRVTGSVQYELCAVFERPSRPELAGDFWSHDVGRHCFTFDVTKEPPDSSFE